jgi:RNA polymerase sigma factor (sigma-70 family)
VTPIPGYQPAAATTNDGGGSDTPNRGYAGNPTPSPSPLDSTFDLLLRAKAGEPGALDRLFARLLPSLRRWASGRLPRSRRDLMDTDDLVQETAVRVVSHVDGFDLRHDRSLQAYLRQAVTNRIRDEIRRGRRVPALRTLDENAPNSDISPLDRAIGQQAVERYAAALARLRPEDRRAIVARVEMDRSYQEIAEALGKPSSEAARVAVSRALLRLAKEMSHAS